MEHPQVCTLFKAYSLIGELKVTVLYKLWQIKYIFHSGVLLMCSMQIKSNFTAQTDDKETGIILLF